jgi:hypothetical protein
MTWNTLSGSFADSVEWPDDTENMVTLWDGTVIHFLSSPPKGLLITDAFVTQIEKQTSSIH